MKIYIAADHGGYKLKEYLKEHLQEKGFVVEDVGAFRFDPEDDYPDFIFPLAEKVAFEQTRGEKVFGIVIGRSGNGEAIAANKVKGIRAALCMNSKMAKKAREDNDANILALGGDYIKGGLAEKIVDAFLSTEFSGKERHKRRIGKITSYETT